jgi:hypothetical protein
MLDRIKYILISFFLLTSTFAFSQNLLRNEWLVGIKNIKLSFSNDSCNASISIPGDSLPYKDHGFSSICDSNGTLLLGTNVVKIWNFKTGKVVEGGEQINNDSIAKYFGGYLVANVSCILPLANNKYVVLISTVDDTKFMNYRNSMGKDTFDFNEVRYSIVDMNKNNGAGKVTVRNKLLLHVQWPWLMKANFTAVQHANGRDWWLIKPCARDKKHQKYTFLIEPDTIRTFYEEQAPYTNKLASNDNVGQSCFNKLGNMYAEIGYNTPIALYDFDRCTGKLVIKRVIDVLPYLKKVNGYKEPLNGGLCFSPNSRYLYFSDFYYAYQIDLSNSNDNEAIQCISTWDSINFPGYYTMQLTPYNQILLGSWHGTSNCSNAIINPDEYGLACNFKQDYLCTNLHPIYPQWVGTTSMPNMPFYDNGALVGSPCDTIKKNVSAHSAWAIYPNPAAAVVNVNVPEDGAQSVQITMYNILGQKVQHQSYTLNYTYSFQHSIGSLAGGLYYARCVTNTGQTYNQKIIKR